MSYQPVLPFTGHSGWAFLQRTREVQQDAFETSGVIQRVTDRFAEKIGGITTPEQLVADRQLLQVALGAFGLDEDIDSKFFVKEVLASNSFDDKSLAGRLSDKRYQSMARAFGFGDPLGPQTGTEGFAAKIIDSYNERQFEIAVGEQDGDMRLLLGFERELNTVLDRKVSDNAHWYSIMATPPLRKVFQTAMNLPDSFGTLDVDRQLKDFKARAESMFGAETVADFADPEIQEKLVQRFLTGSELKQGPSASVRGSAALAILQAGLG